MMMNIVINYYYNCRKDLRTKYGKETSISLSEHRPAEEDEEQTLPVQRRTLGIF
jgi:hypothetical protein